MTNNFLLLITVLPWLAVAATAAAGSTPHAAATPSSVTAQTETMASENVTADMSVTCEYGCEDHREGSEICINKKQHRCSKQGWEPTGRICADPPPIAK